MAAKKSVKKSVKKSAKKSAKTSRGRTYSKGASAKVETAMRERNEGTLRSGGTGKKVTRKKQAIAIGLAEARAAGKKVPKKRSPPKKKKKA